MNLTDTAKSFKLFKIRFESSMMVLSTRRQQYLDWQLGLLFLRLKLKMKMDTND